jgi:hypothetical protein
MQPALVEGCDKQAYKDYCSAPRIWFIPYFGNMDVAKIDRTTLTAFDARRTETNDKKAAVAKYFFFRSPTHARFGIFGYDVILAGARDFESSMGDMNRRTQFQTIGTKVLGGKNKHILKNK